MASKKKQHQLIATHLKWTDPTADIYLCHALKKCRQMDINEHRCMLMLVFICIWAAMAVIIAEFSVCQKVECTTTKTLVKRTSPIYRTHNNTACTFDTCRIVWNLICAVGKCLNLGATSLWTWSEKSGAMGWGIRGCRRKRKCWCSGRSAGNKQCTYRVKDKH